MEYSINPAIRELERAYRFFNQELFGGTLDRKVVITIQSRGRKSVLGWHWAGKWKNGDTTSIAEINLSAEDLKTGDPYETLIHEMAHHLNFQRDSGRLSKPVSQPPLQESGRRGGARGHESGQRGFWDNGPGRARERGRLTV